VIVEGQIRDEQRQLDPDVLLVKEHHCMLLDLEGIDVLLPEHNPEH
jgi:hypothetical protein